MERETVEQKVLHPLNGLVMLAVLILLSIFSVFGFFGATVFGSISLTVICVLLWVILPFMYAGLRSVRPNEALVLTLFGKYHGTILKPGFFFINPFSKYNNPVYEAKEMEDAAELAEGVKPRKRKNAGVNSVRKTVSLKRATLDNGIQKVNDALGNPIIIGAVVLWHVENPTKAVFNVENYTQYLSIQTDSTIRNTARLYPYDVFEDGAEDGNGRTEQTLRGSSQEIAEKMREELSEKVAFAGLVIEEVRITHLSYAEEIAAAMLQRQQASAVISARGKIVDGAVSMVKMALEKLDEDDVVVLDDDKRAQMISNLLVVLCGSKDAQPVVNSGSLF